MRWVYLYTLNFHLNELNKRRQSKNLNTGANIFLKNLMFENIFNYVNIHERSSFLMILLKCFSPVEPSTQQTERLFLILKFLNLMFGVLSPIECAFFSKKCAIVSWVAFSHYVVFSFIWKFEKNFLKNTNNINVELILYLCLVIDCGRLARFTKTITNKIYHTLK